MKEKVTRWVQKVNSGNFSMHPDLEIKLKRLVTSHLNLLSENFSLYFPKSLSEDCQKHKWIINPFTYKDYNDYQLDGTSEDLLIELSNDEVEESHFRKVLQLLVTKLLKDCISALVPGADLGIS